jgi:hypothetical protein
MNITEPTPLSCRRARRTATAGLIVGFIAEGLTRHPPFLHQLLGHPLAAAAFAALLIVTLGSLILWSRQAGYTERRTFVAAIITAAALGGLFAVLAIALGWWSGPAFNMPALAFGLVVCLGATAYFATLLQPQRWLVARRLWWAQLVYILGLLVLLAVVTVLGDEMYLAKGTFVFGRGYTVWHDALYGVIVFSAPFLLYQVFIPRNLKGPMSRNAREAA